VKFRADLGQEFVTITDANLQKVRDEFLKAEASEGATGPREPRKGFRSADRGRKKAKSRKPSATVPGTDAVTRDVEDKAIIAATKLPFPVYYPKLVLRGGRFYDGLQSNKPRTYDLFDTKHKRHRAYRMVVEAPGIGEYYGIQGTNWKDPPLLASPSETRTVRGRKLMLYRDGSRLRVVAWKTPKATYWVSNTLLRSLTNAQMIGIARSLTRIGMGG
jgi:hypothetical protein